MCKDIQNVAMHPHLDFIVVMAISDRASIQAVGSLGFSTKPDFLGILEGFLGFSKFFLLFTGFNVT